MNESGCLTAETSTTRRWRWRYKHLFTAIGQASVGDHLTRHPQESALDDTRRHAISLRSQRPIDGCAFCNVPPGPKTGEADTRDRDKRVTHLICANCAIQTEPDSDECDHIARRLVVDTLAALTRFRVELGHLEGPIQLCARCSPGGLATYWTRDLEEHLVATPAE